MKRVLKNSTEVQVRILNTRQWKKPSQRWWTYRTLRQDFWDCTMTSINKKKSKLIVTYSLLAFSKFSCHIQSRWPFIKLYSGNSVRLRDYVKITYDQQTKDGLLSENLDFRFIVCYLRYFHPILKKIQVCISKSFTYVFSHFCFCNENSRPQARHGLFTNTKRVITQTFGGNIQTYILTISYEVNRNWSKRRIFDNTL